MQSQQLPTESQVFEDEVLAGTESADYPAEEMSERHDHGKNFSGKDRIKLCSKSFISQVYDLLAMHRLPLSNRPHLKNCKNSSAPRFKRKYGLVSHVFRGYQTPRSSINCAITVY
jgi:hypothetical protein